jgi:hypothetical protein
MSATDTRAGARAARRARRRPNGRRVAGAACAALCAAGVLRPAACGAQPSTTGLETGTRSWAVEAGAGYEALTYVRDGVVVGAARRAVAARLGVRRRFAGSPVGARLDAWGVRRRSEAGAFQRTESLLALGLGVDIAIPLGTRVRLEPMLGAGLVPRARGTTDAGPSPGFYPGATESGRVFTAGLTLRVGHVVVAQHALVLLGAERAIPSSREYFPLTVGWRF